MKLNFEEESFWERPTFQLGGINKVINDPIYKTNGYITVSGVFIANNIPDGRNFLNPIKVVAGQDIGKICGLYLYSVNAFDNSRVFVVKSRHKIGGLVV